MRGETPERLAELGALRKLRERWLAASTRVVESYLRSPVFLNWMRLSLAAAIRARAFQENGLARRSR